MGFDKAAQNATTGNKVAYNYKEGEAKGKVVKVKPSGERVVRDGTGGLSKKRQTDLRK